MNPFLFWIVSFLVVNNCSDLLKSNKMEDLLSLSVPCGFVYPVLKAIFCLTNLNNFEKNTDCKQIDMGKTLWKAISGEMTIDGFF